MTLWDKVIIAAVAVVSVCSLLFVNFFVFSKEAEEVLISVDGEIYAKYNFRDITHERNVPIDTKYGQSVIGINKNSVWVKSADCPDLKCVKSGKINLANQMIVCAPLHMTVEIKGGEKVDKVTY